MLGLPTEEPLVVHPFLLQISIIIDNPTFSKFHKWQISNLNVRGLGGLWYTKGDIFYDSKANPKGLKINGTYLYTWVKHELMQPLKIIYMFLLMFPPLIAFQRRECWVMKSIRKKRYSSWKESKPWKRRALLNFLREDFAFPFLMRAISFA